MTTFLANRIDYHDKVEKNRSCRDLLIFSINRIILCPKICHLPELKIL